jgi:outer membrane protein assembly factor BamB
MAGTDGRVLISAPGEDTVAPDSGAVYLFDVETGDLKLSIFNPMASASDEFGTSVAFVDGNLLVGARFTDDGPANTGIAYLFDGLTGELLRTFHHPEPAANDEFGTAVTSVSGNVLIGAPGSAGRPGRAYLFDPNSGELLATFRSPDATSVDLFGSAVAGVGNRVVVGAPQAMVGGNRVGAVYVFEGVPEPATAVGLLAGWWLAAFTRSWRTLLRDQ